MKVTVDQTEKILRSGQPFKQFAFSMMITRLRTKYAKNPTRESLKECTDEINSFIEKFGGIIKDEFLTIQSIK